MTNAEPMAYIGRKTCGCLVFATVDDPKHRKEVAKDVAEAIAAGLAIDRVTCDYVRKNFSRCEHKA